MRSLGAAEPWLYRLPSLLGVAGATLLLFRLARRLFTTEIAWLTIAFFVSFQPVQFAAADARSYGLGLFFVVLSTELLLRLIDRPSYPLSVLYGITAGMIMHFHLLFGTILAVHFVYVLRCSLAGRRIPAPQVTVAAIVLIGTIVPLVQQYRVALRDAKVHSFMGRPELTDLLLTFFPTAAAVALIVGGIVLMITVPRMTLSFSSDRLDRGLVVLWALLPPLLLFALSRSPRLMCLSHDICCPFPLASLYVLRF